MALTFLLPLKYGSMAGLPEIVFSLPNTNILTIFIFTWSPVSFTLLSGILLILTILFMQSDLSDTPPPEKRKTSKREIDVKLFIPLSTVMLLISVFPGVINASTKDFVYLQIIHFSGISAYVITMFLILKARPEKKEIFVNTIIAGTLMVSLLGLKQYYTGFQETLNYIYTQELKTGVKVSGAIMNRLLQTRIYSTFSICNSLAAHLILTIPISIYALYKFKSTFKTVCIVFSLFTIFAIAPDLSLTPMLILTTLSGLLAVFAYKYITEENFHSLKWLTIIPLSFLLLFILRHTSSRGAFLGFGLSIIFFIFFSKIKRNFKILFSFIIFSVATYMIFSDIFTRSLSSMSVRFDYYLAALKMFYKHPIFGIGWGDFFHEYTRIKTFPTQEAPHTPHNFVLSFASQAGILGACISILVLILPFFYLYLLKNKDTSERPNDDSESKIYILCILTGWLAWATHSLLDLNIQVPGTVATAFLLLLLLPKFTLKRTDIEFSNTQKKLIKIIIVLLSCIIVFYSYKRLKQEKSLYILQKLCNFKIVPEKPKKIPFKYIEYQLQHTTKLMPYSPFPWSIAGMAAINSGYYSKAEIYYKKAIEKSPKRALFYEKLAKCQLLEKKYNEAKSNHNKAKSLFPNAFQKTLKSKKSESSSK